MLNERYTQEELYHWGIKGMKWGVRRFQNKDGSLTAKGRVRYADDEGTLTKTGKKIKEAYNQHRSKKARQKQASKPMKDLTDEELNERIKRLERERTALDLERQISNMSPKSVSAGKAFMSIVGNQVLKPAMINAGKDVLTKFLQKKGMDLAGLGEAADALSGLRKEVESLNLFKQKDELDQYFNKKTVNSNDYDINDIDNWTDDQVAKRATRQENINKITGKGKGKGNGGGNGQGGGQNQNSKPKDAGNDSSEQKVEQSTGTRSSKYTPKKFSGTYTYKKATADTPKKEFQVSNSNARPVHEIYMEQRKRAEGTVENLYKSGYMMTPISKLQGTSSSTFVSGGSNRKLWLDDIGDWRMRDLDSMGYPGKGTKK